ncbi:hypothetical protein PUMCH_004549 [Australozyma saopauloensis]|uniref:Uncharacterized protein n=1 Tax=Australozyma saopauloensis TaxID=291208 RepID=A0AAX4HFE8_9ASCO|nr:hypothetical protein PUMCH_004549 [[Candida] saopauloensis]
MTSPSNDVSIKRKRGRPPKKQPLEVYESFTSQFQMSMTPAISGVEFNSQSMIQIGEPNCDTPTMEVFSKWTAPKKRNQSVARRRSKDSFVMDVYQSPGSQSSLDSPKMIQRGSTSSLKALHIPIQNSNFYSKEISSFNFPHNNCSDALVYSGECPLATPCSVEFACNKSPLEKEQPRLGSYQSEVDAYWQSCQRSIIDDHEVIGHPQLVPTSPLQLNDFHVMKCPGSGQSELADPDFLSFNLVVDHKGMAALSFGGSTQADFYSCL